MNHLTSTLFLRGCLFLFSLTIGQGFAAVEKSPVVLFMIGELEYQTAETLPEFARSQLEPQGIRCLYALATERDPNHFEGLEGLPEADVLILSVRRRTPDIKQMTLIKQHLQKGKPMVAIRTSSHAFDRDIPDENHVRWTEFDRDILGADYENHYGNKPPEDPPTQIWIDAQSENHPLLKGVEKQFQSTSHLYKNRRLHPEATTLLFGKVAGRSEVEPVAWIFKSGSSPIFYTSLGSPDDFKNPSFVQLLNNAIRQFLD